MMLQQPHMGFSKTTKFPESPYLLKSQLVTFIKTARFTRSIEISTNYQTHQNSNIHQYQTIHQNPRANTINKFTIHNQICQNSRFTKIPGFTRNTTLAKITRFTKAPDLPESIQSPNKQKLQDLTES